MSLAHSYVFAQLSPAQEARNRMRVLLKPQVFQSSCEVQATEAIIRCQVYFPSPAAVPTGGEQAVAIVRFDTSTSRTFDILPLIRLRIPVFINGCRSLSVFRKNSDSVFIVQTALTGLKPATTYFVRLWQNVAYLSYDVEQTDGNPFSSDTTFIHFTTASVSPLPRFLTAFSIVSDGFTLRWTAPDRLQALCTLELSTDAQFQNILQTRTVQPTDSVRFTRLAPNTPYFYRLRVKSGTATNDIIGENPVRTLSLATLTATQMPLHTFLRGIPRPFDFPIELTQYYCATDSRYYRYRKNTQLSLAETEALLQNLTTRGIAFDTAWVQSNSTCKNDSMGTSELVVKVPRENVQMDSLGFFLGHTDWAGPCECRQFRTYTRLVPSSAQERTALVNVQATISPNPATEAANISLSLPISSLVRLTLHDALGCEVRMVANGIYAEGVQEFSVSLGGLPSGMYFLRCSVGARILVRHLSVMR